MENNKTNSVTLIERNSTGIRSYFMKVYNYMAGGLALSGLIAYLCTKQPMVGWFYNLSADGYLSWTLLGWVAVFSPLLFIFMINSAAGRLDAKKSQLYFWLFSATMGVSLSNILFLYSTESIAQAFVVTAAAFGGLSLYGYTTQKSLTGMGSFLFMGLIGVIVASIINIFVQSSAFMFGINILALLIFIGLTAYDTQKLKEIYNENDGSAEVESKAIIGAMALYLDFINMFRLLLYFLNDRR